MNIFKKTILLQTALIAMSNVVAVDEKIAAINNDIRQITGALLIHNPVIQANVLQNSVNRSNDTARKFKKNMNKENNFKELYIAGAVVTTIALVAGLAYKYCNKLNFGISKLFSKIWKRK